MPSRNKIGATTGIIAPILAFTCILAAIASYSQFSWTNNALSDLGVIPGITGSLFNFGIYTCGFLALIFTLFSLSQFIPNNWLGKTGVGFFAAATIALISIGVFNENFSPIHYLVSVAFFTLLPIGMFLITGALAFNHQKKMALLTLLGGVAAAAPWILYFAVRFVSGVAIPEFVSGLVAAIWIILLSYKILTED